jgi:hypothetical protein
LQNLIRLEGAIAGIAGNLAQDAGGFELRQVIAGSLERHVQVFGYLDWLYLSPHGSQLIATKSSGVLYVYQGVP